MAIDFAIILPVRNGSNYIKQCIDSILNQVYPHFELIILENASTDNTLEIINFYTDSRIKTFSAKQPLSIEDNWGRIVNTPKNTFITLLGHDDVLQSDYLQNMHALISQHPNAGLYQSHFSFIDSNGEKTRKCKPMHNYYSPEEAVGAFMNGSIDLLGTGFMMRATDYDRIGGIPLYPNLLFADMELFIELALNGGLAVSNKESFYYRIHQNATTSSSTNKAYFDGFRMLVHFLIQLKKNNISVNNTIEKFAPAFIDKYGQTITHKVLKTSKKERQIGNVNDIIEKLNILGSELINSDYNIIDNKKIKLAKIIDGNPLLHALYLQFRKFYKKPVF